MDANKGKPTKSPSPKRLVIWLLIAPLCLYLLSSLIVFDFTSAAYPFDQEHDRQGVRVAYGPRPRRAFVTPPYHDFFYVGDEWAFKAYQPICAAWRHFRGYATPMPRR